MKTAFSKKFSYNYFKRAVGLGVVGTGLYAQNNQDFGFNRNIQFLEEYSYKTGGYFDNDCTCPMPGTKILKYNS